MNIEEAYKTIITGHDRFARGRKIDCEFAVWVNRDYDVSVLHITDRRAKIYDQDLKAKGRKIYKEYVGTYNFLIEMGDFAGDVQYVVDLLRKTKEMMGSNPNEYLH